LSDNVVSVERNQQAEEASNVALLRVLKCRHSGDTGKADTIDYNINTGRLLPVNPFQGEEYNLNDSRTSTQYHPF